MTETESRSREHIEVPVETLRVQEEETETQIKMGDVAEWRSVVGSESGGCDVRGGGGCEM